MLRRSNDDTRTRYQKNSVRNWPAVLPSVKPYYKRAHTLWCHLMAPCKIDVPRLVPSVISREQFLELSCQDRREPFCARAAKMKTVGKHVLRPFTGMNRYQ